MLFIKHTYLTYIIKKELTISNNNTYILTFITSLHMFIILFTCLKSRSDHTKSNAPDPIRT